MISNINEQVDKVLDEINRSVSREMIFSLDDLVSYNISKRSSNFTTFNTILKSKLLSIATTYNNSKNEYRKK